MNPSVIIARMKPLQRGQIRFVCGRPGCSGELGYTSKYELRDDFEEINVVISETGVRALRPGHHRLAGHWLHCESGYTTPISTLEVDGDELLVYRQIRRRFDKNGVQRGRRPNPVAVEMAATGASPGHMYVNSGQQPNLPCVVVCPIQSCNCRNIVKFRD